MIVFRVGRIRNKNSKLEYWRRDMSRGCVVKGLGGVCWGRGGDGRGFYLGGVLRSGKRRVAV